MIWTEWRYNAWFVVGGGGKNMKDRTWKGREINHFVTDEQLICIIEKNVYNMNGSNTDKEDS